MVSYNILMGSDHAPNMSHVTKNAEGRYPDPHHDFPMSTPGTMMCLRNYYAEATYFST